MWVVKRVTRDFDDVWEHVVSEHATEAEADAECDRCEQNNPWPYDSYIVQED